MQTIRAVALFFMLGLSVFAQDRTAWMRDAKWGVMTHFLADWISPHAPMTPERWNGLIDHFDVEGLAQQLESVGAGYYVFTLGQNSGFYLAPNAAYDRIVGASPSKCARRDLISDLATALNKRGIRLVLYLPSGAPDKDEAAIAKLGWHKGAYRNREFQQNWEEVIREWSKRYGAKISGWWFDGCYWPNSMYRSEEAPNFRTFAAAARAGNPQNALAFNPGVFQRLLSLTPEDDYTAGEINDPQKLEIRRAEAGKVDGRQIHMLSYLGERWGQGNPRFTTEQVIESTRKILAEGGAVTWDTPIQTTGRFSDQFINQLTTLGKALRK